MFWLSIDTLNNPSLQCDELSRLLPDSHALLGNSRYLHFFNWLVRTCFRPFAFGVVFLLLQQSIYCDAQPIGFQGADNVSSIPVLCELRDDHYLLSSLTDCIQMLFYSNLIHNA